MVKIKFLQRNYEAQLITLFSVSKPPMESVSENDPLLLRKDIGKVKNEKQK